MKDAFLWPNFAQDIGINIGDFWNTLLKNPVWTDGDLNFNKEGKNPHWIPGSHTALNYRGNAIKRHKIWCQTEYNLGLKKYRYTGWQHAISYATCDYSYVPGMKEFKEAINNKLKDKKYLGKSGKEHNHWIITKYNDENDNIGFHNDKDNDFEEDSYIVVVKMGEPRLFELRIGTEKPFWSKIVQAGTGIFMGTGSSDGKDANRMVQHSVPKMKSKVGVSGSIVSRCVKTVVPWDQVHKAVVRSKKAKLRRIKNKNKK